MAKRDDQNEDEQKNEDLNKDSDDSFGLPEIEYQPIQRKEEPTEEPAQDEPSYETKSYETTAGYEEEKPTETEKEPYQYKPYEEEEESSIGPKIIAILVVIVVALAAGWYLVIYQPKQKAEAERVRIEAERATAQKAKEEEENRLRLQRQAVEKRRLDSLEALKTPPAGSIETLSSRTGRYYVVISSALDRDLLMDYAKKLGAKGVSSKIIPPFGKHKVSRITIAEGESFADTQAKADALKAEYGDALWVLKY